jgi:hypothetical protein
MDLRRQPETWLFAGLRRLYGKLKGGRAPIAGPLHRFTVACAELIDRDIAILGLDAWKKRLRDLDAAEKAFAPSTGGPTTRLMISPRGSRRGCRCRAAAAARPMQHDAQRDQ